MPLNSAPMQLADSPLLLASLVAELERCENDTVRLLGPTSIKRMLHWRRHRDDPIKLAAFVRDCLHRTSVTGWALHQKGGLTLEAIAISFGPPLFSKQDVDHARETLGLAAVAAVVLRR